MTLVEYAWMIAALSGWAVAGVLGWALGSARSRADWCLEGWNRTCALNDKHRDLIERQYDRIHDMTLDLVMEQARGRELAEEIGEMRTARQALEATDDQK